MNHKYSWSRYPHLYTGPYTGFRHAADKKFPHRMYSWFRQNYTRNCTCHLGHKGCYCTSLSARKKKHSGLSCRCCLFWDNNWRHTDHKPNQTIPGRIDKPTTQKHTHTCHGRYMWEHRHPANTRYTPPRHHSRNYRRTCRNWSPDRTQYCKHNLEPRPNTHLEEYTTRRRPHRHHNSLPNCNCNRPRHPNRLHTSSRHP